jgi:membrane protease YdiL (CAAX protease family)
MNASPSSPTSETLDSSTTSKALGGSSRPLRFLIVTLAVAVYIALGFLLHTDAYQYLLLGIPLLILFQLGVHRQPLRAMWVRSGPPLRLDLWFFVLWILFSLMPIYFVWTARQQSNVEMAAYSSAAIFGAFGLAYAVRAMRLANVRQLGFCIFICVPIFFLFLLPSFRQWHTYPLLTGLAFGAQQLLILTPVTFIMEEVFFRGVLDTYLHQDEKRTGWPSAIYVSALWGLWHLPISLSLSKGALHWNQILITIAYLLIVQIAIGVPLSIWWRRSGNLVVTGTTHALLDTIRNVLVGI